MPRHQRNAYGTERAAEGHKGRGIQGPDQSAAEPAAQT